METVMVPIILLQNWHGGFKGTRLEVNEKKAKKLVDGKIARYATLCDPPPKKAAPVKGLTTEQAFSKKGKK